MYPAWEIMITNRHEGGAWGDNPEIVIKVHFPDGSSYPDDEKKELRDLDVPNRPYYYRRTQDKLKHGPCLDRIKKIHVIEEDPWPNPDDTVACWKDILVTKRGTHYLSAASGDCKEKDAATTFNVTRF